MTRVQAAGTALQLEEISLPRQFKDRNIKQAVYDSKGLIWFFTNRDVYRFDGSNVVALGQQFGIQPYSIKFIFCDANDRLWIGTRQLLIRLDLKTWKHHAFNFPTATEDIGTAGPSGFVMVTREGRVLVAAGWGKLFELKDERLDLVLDLKGSISEGTRTGAINWIYQRADGDIWVTTAYVGSIIRLHRQNDRYLVKDIIRQDWLSDKSVFHPVYHDSGEILFVTNTGELKILHCDSKDIQNVRIPQPIRCAYLTPLSQHQVLVATIENQFFIYDFQKNDIAAADEEIRHLMGGRRIPEHNNYNFSRLIVYESGQERGIFHVATDSEKPGIEAIGVTRGNSIRAIYKHPRGDLYLGTYSEGFLRIDANTGAKTQLTNLLFVYKIVPWSADTLLLGVEGDGLYWYHISKGTFSQALSGYGNLYEKYITSIVRAGDLVWVGCYQGFYLADLRKRQIIERNGNNADFAARQVHVSALYMADSLLWVCSVDGLFVFEYGKKGKVVYHSNDQTACTALAFAENRVYVATIGRGIVVLDRRTFSRLAWIDETKNLAGNLVYSIGLVRDMLLAGTNNGLSRISLQTGSVQNYRANDGLSSNEFNTGSLFATQDTLFMGTVSGVVQLPVAKLLTAAPKSSGALYVTHLFTQTKDNQRNSEFMLPYHSGREIIIPPDVISFTVCLGGDITGAEDEVPYFFRLNRDMAWSRLGNDKEISLVRPDPGSYRLEVGTASPNGQISAIVTNEVIRIEPHFSETIAFRLLIIITVLLSGMAVFRYLERQREKERNLRLKIAEDLHDEVGGLISGLALQADFLQYADESQRKDYLRKIVDTGRLAVKSMHDVVWSIDPRNDNAMVLTERMKDYAGFALKPAGIHYSFESSGITELTFLSQQERQSIWLIYKEAITNVCKHSQAGEVKIALNFGDSQWQMCIADNGNGLGSSSGQGNGLKNMQNRAQKIRADLKIESGTGGVTIMLSKIKAGYNYLSG